MDTFLQKTDHDQIDGNSENGNQQSSYYPDQEQRIPREEGTLSTTYFWDLTHRSEAPSLLTAYYQQNQYDGSFQQYDGSIQPSPSAGGHVTRVQAALV